MEDGPSTRTIARIVLVGAGLGALAYLLYLVRSVVLLVGIAAFLALALGPPVDWAVRRGASRGLAILAVYVALAVGVVAVGLAFVPSVATGVQTVANNAPSYVAKLRRSSVFRKYDKEYKISAKIQEQLSTLPRRLGDAAGALRDVTVGVFGALVQLATVLTLAFFMLLEAPRLLAGFFRRLGEERGARTREIGVRIYRAVGGYVAGNLAISVVAGLVSFVTLAVLGIPFAGPLAVLMALFDLLPLVGATIGAVIVGVVTLFHGFPASTIVWTVVQILYQQVESNVVFPVVYRRTVNVNGFVTILAVLLGAELLGILGALVAIPIAGAVQIVAVELWNERQTRLSDAVVAP